MLKIITREEKERQEREQNRLVIRPLPSAADITRFLGSGHIPQAVVPSAGTGTGSPSNTGTLTIRKGTFPTDSDTIRTGVPASRTGTAALQPGARLPQAGTDTAYQLTHGITDLSALRSGDRSGGTVLDGITGKAGSLLRQAGADFSNLRTGYGIRGAMAWDANPANTTKTPENPGGKGNFAVGAKWTAYWNAMTEEERKTAERLASDGSGDGRALGQFVNSLNLNTRLRKREQDTAAAKAAAMERNTANAKRRESPAGRVIAARVTGKDEYLSGVQPAGQNRNAVTLGELASGRGTGARDRYLTTPQKETIRKYAEAGDFAAVAEYYESLRPTLDMLEQGAERSAHSRFARKHPVLSMGSEVALNLAGGLLSLGRTIAGNVQDTVTGEYHPIDPNDPAFALQAAAVAQRTGAEDQIQSGILRFLRSGTVSVMDNLSKFYLGAALGLSGSALESFTLGSMSTQAAGNAVYENLRNGQDNADALLNGLVSGGIEYGTERLPTEKWMEAIGKFDPANLKGSVRTLIRELPGQMGAEAVEEVIGNLTEQSWDVLWNGEQSEYARRVRELTKQGVSEDAAQSSVFSDLMIRQTLEAAAEAAFSVLLMDGVPAAGKTARRGLNQVRFAAAGQTLRKSGGDAIENEIRKGLLFPAESPAHEQAEKVRDSWDSGRGAVTNRELGRLAFRNAEAVWDLAAELADRDYAVIAANILNDAAEEIAVNDKVPIEAIRRMMEIARSGGETADPELTGAAELATQVRNLDLDADGVPLVSYTDAARAVMDALPGATQAQIRDFYRQYREDNRTVLFGGHRLTKAQFTRLFQENTTRNLSEQELSRLFNQAILDTLDGSDAYERYAQPQTANPAASAENAADTADTQSGAASAGTDSSSRAETEADPYADLPFSFGDAWDGKQVETRTEAVDETDHDAKQAETQQAPDAADTGTDQTAETRNAGTEAADTGNWEAGLDAEDGVTSEVSAKLDDAAREKIDTVSKLLGKRVRFADSVAGGIANGTISGNDILLDRSLVEAEDADNSGLVWKVLGHELSHGVQSSAEGAWARFRDAVAREDAVQDHARAIRTIHEARGYTITEAEALDEAAADYAGDLLRDTDAAERFIERNRQDKPLLTRVRDAIVKLIRKLTGAEKRQLQTVRGLFDAALDAAAENARERGADTNAAEQSKTAATTDGGTRFSLNGYDPETASVKEQIENSQIRLNQMEVVAIATVPEHFKSKKAASKWAIDLLRSTGYAVERQGFGRIIFNQADINYAINYADTDGEKAALAVLPKVLKRGIEIGHHNNHKERGKETITFAAPVRLNGIRGNMAVVVNRRSNHYYAHRIVMPDGSTFVFSENTEKDTAQEPSWGVAVSSSLAKTTSAASDHTIVQSPTKSKPQFSLKGTENAATARRMAELETRNRALEAEVKVWQRKRAAEKSLANARKNVVIGEVNRFAADFLNRFYGTLDTDLTQRVQVKDIRSGILHLMNHLLSGPDGDGSGNVSNDDAYQVWIRSMEDQARTIAGKVVESALAQRENPEREALNQWRSELRRIGESGGISIDALRTDTDPAGVEMFRRRNQMRMGLRKNGAGIDTFWDDWAKRYGQTFFPNDIYAPADMLRHVEELLDRTRVSYENPFADPDTLEAAEECKNALLNDMTAFLEEADLARRSALPVSEKAALRDAAYRQGVRDTENRLNAQTEKAREQIRTERAESEKRLKESMARAKEAVRVQREKGDQRLKEYRDALKERSKDRAARQEKHKIRTQLDRLMTRLNNRKMLQRDRALLNSIYQNLDAIAKGTLGVSAQEVYANQMWLWDRIDEKSDHYDEDFIRNPTFQTVSGQMGFADAMEERKRTPEQMRDLKDRTAELSPDQLRRVCEFLMAFDHAQRTIDRMIQSRDRRDLNRQADEVIDHVRAARGFHPAGALIASQMLSFKRFARRITGYAPTDALVSAVEDLAEGERKRDTCKQEAMGFLLDRYAKLLGLPTERLTGKQRKDVERRLQESLASFSGKDAAAPENLIEIHGTDAVRGTAVTVHITRGMRAALYMHTLNEDNMRHVSGGGVTVPSDAGYAYYRKGKYAEAYTHKVVRVRLTKAQADAACAGMTKEEQAFAEALAWYYDAFSKPRLSAVHEALKGWSPFHVDHYMPIETDKLFTEKKFDWGALSAYGTIDTPGFSLERLPASNPILLRDINLTAFDSIDQHARFIGLAIPVRNLSKLLNRNRVTIDTTDALSLAFGEEEAGRIQEQAESIRADEQADNMDAALRLAVKKLHGSAGLAKYTEAVRENGAYYSVRAEIGAALGKKATGYLENAVRSITMPSKAGSPVKEAFFRLTHNYAGSVLTLSGSVASVQGASYPTAAAVIGWTPLLRALRDLPSTAAGKADLKLINAYTSRLWERSQGFSSHEAQILKGERRGLPNALNWIQGMDVGTTTLLWKACEYYVEQAQPDLAKSKGSRQEILDGNSPFYLAVADIYNQVLEESQPAYGAVEKAAILRDESDIVRLTNMFKTQMFQNFNILYDAIGELGARRREYAGIPNAQTKAALDRAWRSVGNAASGVLFAQFLAAFIKFLFARFIGKDDKYRDAEGNLTFGSAAKGIALGTIGSLPGMVAYGSDVYSALAYAVDKGILKGLGKDPFFNETFYGVNVQVAESLTNTAKHFTGAVQEILSAAHGVAQGLDEEGNGYHVNWQHIGGKSLKAAEDALMLWGVPARNIEKLLTGFARMVTGASFGSAMGEYALLHLSADPRAQEDKSQYYSLLFRTGGKKLYPDPDKAPEEYRNLYRVMVEHDGFDKDDVQARMKALYLKTRQYQSAYNDFRSLLGAETARLSGYALLSADLRETLSDRMDTAAKYAVLASSVDGYQAGNGEKWVREAMDFGQTYHVSLAPLVLLRAGRTGIEGIPDPDPKDPENPASLPNSKSLQIMERAYELYPEMRNWDSTQRATLFQWLGVGEKVSGWTEEEVQKGRSGVLGLEALRAGRKKTTDSWTPGKPLTVSVSPSSWKSW